MLRKQKLSRRHLLVLLSAWVFLLSDLTLFTHIKTSEFHGDETGWISSGYYYSSLLLRADSNRQHWRGDGYEAFGYNNMVLGKWMIGLPLIACSVPGSPWLRQYYHFGDSIEENVAQGHLPPPTVLLWARSFVAKVGAACCVLVFLIGSLSYGIRVGALAALLVLTNHLFILCVTRAMTDAHYNLFLLATCLAAVLFLKGKTHRYRWLTASVCGLMTGFSCSVKITGILLGSALFAAVIFYVYSLRRPGQKQELTHKNEVKYSLILFAGIAFGTIYGLNPNFWPVFHLHSMFHLYSMSLHPLLDLQPLWNFPQMFIDLSNLMESQKDTPSASWFGHRPLTLSRELFVTYTTFLGEWFFCSLGFAASSKMIYTAWKRREAAAPALPMLYFVINFAFIFMFQKLNWDRYYLPTVIASQFLAAVGICETVRCVHSLRYSRLSTSAWLDKIRCKLFA